MPGFESFQKLCNMGSELPKGFTGPRLEFSDKKILNVSITILMHLSIWHTSKYIF